MARTAKTARKTVATKKVATKATKGKTPRTVKGKGKTPAPSKAKKVTTKAAPRKKKVTTKKKVAAKTVKAKRVSLAQSDVSMGITNPALKRLSLKAGILRISKETLELLRISMKGDVETLIRIVEVITRHHQRRTVKKTDVEAALLSLGVTSGVSFKSEGNSYSTCSYGPKKDNVKQRVATKVRMLQKNVECFVVPRAPFERLMRASQSETGSDALSFSAESLELVQLFVEARYLDMLVSCKNLAESNKRPTVTVKDLEAVHSIKGVLSPHV